MIELLKAIKEIKTETKADHVVLGNENDDCSMFILAIQKGSFEQHNKMPLDSNNTVESIIASFNQSYSDHQENDK